MWREALLAQAVLADEAKGYRNHPQLDRFRAVTRPAAHITEYPRAVHTESIERNYCFDESKTGRPRSARRLAVTSGQIDFEWQHLMKKIETRAPERHEKFTPILSPDLHPLFRVIPGGIADWEHP